MWPDLPAGHMTWHTSIERFTLSHADLVRLLPAVQALRKTSAHSWELPCPSVGSVIFPGKVILPLAIHAPQVKHC